MKISTETKVADALNAHPSVIRVFDKYKLRCAGCGGAAAESLAMCARTYGLDPDKLVAEINAAIKAEPDQGSK